MSIKLVHKQIDKFLGSTTPEVLAIRGKWGVGKTFTWNQFLVDAAHRNAVGLERYSYVSLFGINSLDSLKFAMFEQVVDVEAIDHKPSIDTFRKSTETLGKSLGRKSIRVIQGLPYVKNVSLALEAVSFLSLKNTIICIDDLERKGDDLKIRDVLGLVSLLKEQRDCKVVLILNDDSFEKNESEQLDRYREKVIDFDVLFSPTSDECSEIALNEDFEYLDILKKYILSLGVSNIRIIRKMLYLSRSVAALLKDYEAEVTHQAIHSLVLFALCHFQPDDSSVPSIDYVRNIGYSLWGLGKDEESDKEKKWNSLLRSYGFQNCDEFDLEIADAVVRGFYDESKLISEANSLNQKIVADKVEGSFKQAWEKYHNTFDDNEEELVYALYEGFKKSSKYISPLNLNGTVELLRDLGHGDKADELIELYVAEREGNPESLNLEMYPFSDDIQDKKIIQRFDEIASKTVDNRSLEDVVSSLVGTNGWNRSDIEVLSRASVDDFYTLFKGTKGPQLGRYVEVCLQFFRIVNIGDKERKVSENARNALIKIGKESTLNRRRVSKFGVRVDD